MSDEFLPTLKVERPPVPQEPLEYELRISRTDEHASTGRRATTQHAIQFLELAGYRVIDPPGVEQLRKLIDATRESEPDGHRQLDCDLFAAHIRRVSDAGRSIASYLYVILGKP